MLTARRLLNRTYKSSKGSERLREYGIGTEKNMQRLQITTIPCLQINLPHIYSPAASADAANLSATALAISAT